MHCVITWSHDQYNNMSGVHIAQGGCNKADGGGILCTEHLCRVRYNKAASEGWHSIHGIMIVFVCMYVRAEQLIDLIDNRDYWK